MRTEVCGLRPWRVGARPRTSAGRVAERLALARAGAGLAGRWRCALGCAVAAAERRVPSSRRRPPLAGSFLCALARAPQRPPLSRPRFLSPAPPRRRPRRRPSATMALRGSPRAPKGPGPTARAPSPGAPPPPPPPRSRPLLLLLLLLAACGAAGRSPEPGRLGPRARLTRAPPNPPAGRALPGGGEDRQARDEEPGTPGPGQAPGPGEDGAPAAGQGRWARAAPMAGAASRAQVSLISTSFVLKGDATHNQAMVHWTGENSSVSDLRAPPASPDPDTSEPPLMDGPAVTPLFSETWGRELPWRRPCGPWATCEEVSRYVSTLPYLGDISTDFQDSEPSRGHPHWPPDRRLGVSLEVSGPRPPWGAPRPFKITPNSVLHLYRLHALPGPPSAALGFSLHPGLPGTRSWHLHGLQDLRGQPRVRFWGSPSPGPEDPPPDAPGCAGIC